MFELLLYFPLYTVQWTEMFTMSLFLLLSLSFSRTFFFLIFLLIFKGLFPPCIIFLFWFCSQFSFFSFLSYLIIGFWISSAPPLLRLLSFSWECFILILCFRKNVIVSVKLSWSGRRFRIFLFKFFFGVVACGLRSFFSFLFI